MYTARAEMAQRGGFRSSFHGNFMTGYIVLQLT
jgi:hypothetical protein